MAKGSKALRCERRMLSVAFLPFYTLTLIRTIISFVEKGSFQTSHDAFYYVFFVVFTMMIADGIVGFAYIKTLGKKYQPLHNKVELYEPLDCAVVEYFVAVFLPLLVSDVRSNGEAVFFLCLVLVVTVLTEKSGIQYRNPMILLSGYKTVKCKIEVEAMGTSRANKSTHWEDRIGLISDRNVVSLNNQDMYCGVVELGNACAWLQLEGAPGETGQE